MENFQEKLTKKIIQFRDERDWRKFHTAKDLAMCLSVESNEVLELFLWKKEDEIDQNRLIEELGDVFYSLLLLSERFNIDLLDAFEHKIQLTQKKYPVEDFFGSNKKYNEV